MTTTAQSWQIEGDYFENCNCDVVCPCLFSTGAPFSAMPTEGACEVAFGFHIDRGSFGDIRLDGLNAALVARTPGAMGAGNWTLAAYFDERADDAQFDGLHAIFGGAAGGPVGLLAPLVGNILGAKRVPITYRRDGKRRSVEIPSIMQLAVHAVPSFDPDHEIWAENAHPFADRVAMAVGDEGSTFSDYGMRWDNSGKNGHYAPITWSGAR